MPSKYRGYNIYRAVDDFTSSRFSARGLGYFLLHRKIRERLQIIKPAAPKGVPVGGDRYMPDNASIISSQFETRSVRSVDSGDYVSPRDGYASSVSSKRSTSGLSRIKAKFACRPDCVSSFGFS